MEFIKASEAHEVARKSNRNTIVLEELNNIISTSAKSGNSQVHVEYELHQLEENYQEMVVKFLENKGYEVYVGYAINMPGTSSTPLNFGVSFTISW